MALRMEMCRLYCFVLLWLVCSMGTGANGQNRIVVSKREMRLCVLSPSQDTLLATPVACGREYGNKRRIGDGRTPEGTFYVVSVERSSGWMHDFGDGQGLRAGAYGPLFVRLRVPGFRGIGIHGTCFPGSVGSRCSEGCVRVSNMALLQLTALIGRGCCCTILPDE